MYWQREYWLSIALSVSLALWFSPVLADNKDENDIPWYQIEVIIFANQNYMGIASETWPDAAPIDMNHIIELHRPGEYVADKGAHSAAANTPVPYELLDKSQLQLTPVEHKLKASSQYQPLIHIAWRQPTLAPNKADPVFVYLGMENPPAKQYVQNNPSSQIVMRGQGQSGNRFSSVPMSSSFSVDDSQYGQIFPATEADTYVGPAPSTLFGTLRLSVSRYLHLEADLDYRIPVMKEEIVPVDEEDFSGSSILQNAMFNSPNQTTQTKVVKRQVLQNFTLRETRRMRSKEIHYFDNPAIGIIVRVIPYEIPKVEQPAFDPNSQAFKSGARPAGSPPR